MSAPTESPFCDVCERNQLLLNKTLAEYLPDEDDPEYEKYANSVDEYRAQLEERYPQVCENCIGRVQEQIRAAGYVAKADNLRRLLDQSKKYQTQEETVRQWLTLSTIWLAKWTYVASVVVELIWHAAGSFIRADGTAKACFYPYDCFSNAFLKRWVSEACVVSPVILRLVEYALLLDLLTIWWNPQLAKKTNRAGGRMRGLRTTWTIRASSLFVRFLGLLALSSLGEGSVTFYRYTHAALFAILILSTAASWTRVHIVYLSTKSLMQPLSAHLPNVSAPQSPANPGRQQHRQSLPNNSSFDTMAASFTSSFSSINESMPTLPPSPTLTAKSTSTSIHYDSDGDTPFRRKNTPRGDDAMDWTPTPKRFAPHAPSVIPFQFSQSQSQSHHSPSSPLPAQRSPVSIFSKPDPNPFRHRVPAAPKAPLASKVDPWKAGVWAPPLKETTPNFFKENRGTREGGLQGVGVPRNVQRDAELFASPKLKYDYFGERKDTGLEDTFNGLFSK
jgi:hypothetical protein